MLERRARWILWCLPLGTAAAQQYVISTLAGGVPPSAPSLSTTDSFVPGAVAVDPTGHVLFTSGECLFRLTGPTVSLVAGNSRPGFSGDGGLAAAAELMVGGPATGPSGGLTIDPAGNIYIADAGNNRVRKISANGVIATVAGSSNLRLGDGGPAVNASLATPRSVAIDASGNLFIAEWASGLIRKVSASGMIATVAGGGSAAPTNGAQATSITLSNPVGVAVDGSGNLFVSDTGANWILEVSPAGLITIVAGTGVQGFSGDGGPATAARVAGPSGLAFDSGGNLFFADSINSRVREISTSGVISTVAGGGRSTPNGVAATQATVFDPVAVAVDSNENLYIASDTWLEEVSAAGIISIIAGNGYSSYGGDGGPATMALFSSPGDIAIGPGGVVYIADTVNCRIRKVDNTGTISTVAGTGVLGYSGDGGPANLAKLNAPLGLALDGAGNLYIADTNNNRVRMVSPSGTITTVAGNGFGGYSGDGIPATNASLYVPYAVALDADGNLFIADYLNYRIRKVAATGIITTVAGTGVLGLSGDGGPATSAQISVPVGLAIDPSGDLFIADAINGRIREVLPDGTISTVAGTTGTAPKGVAVDHSGNLFVANDFGPVILKLSSAGASTAIAGSPTASSLLDGVPAIDTALGGAFGLKVDSTGRVLFADGINSVRILTPANPSVLIAAVADAASESAIPVSPGKIVVVYGAGMGPGRLAVNQPVNGVYSTQLAGTTVSFNGTPAPLLYTSSTAVAAVVPFGLTGSTALVTVSYLGSASDAFSVPVTASEPSIFSLNGTGSGQAAAENADYSINTAANPALVGSIVSLYATGGGQTAPSGADGQLAPTSPPYPQPQFPVSVTVGGLNASVLYAGAAPGEIDGLMQLVIQIPSGVTPGGYVPVVLKIGAASTAGGALWIAVSAPAGSN